MATINLKAASVRVKPTTGEKVAGLLGDIDVPLTSIRSVSVADDGLAAARGIRAPGLAIPGLRKIGTWRRRGGRTAVIVRRGQPAVRLELEGHNYFELLVGTVDAERTADRIRAAVEAS